MTWQRGTPSSHLAEGQTIEDVVQTTVTKVLLGQRKWDPARQPDLLQFLKDVVRSELSNLARSKDNQTAGLGDAEPLDARRAAPPDDLTPDEDRALDAIRKLAETRTDVRKVLDAI